MILEQNKYENIWKTKHKNLEEEIKETTNQLQYSLDLCFLVDCTGSMKKSIEEVKNKIFSIIRQVKDQIKGLKTRIAFLGYTDIDFAEEDQFKILNFVPAYHYKHFTKFLDKIEAAEKGLDTAEDVVAGIDKVKELNWNSISRILIHIGDAPPHGMKYQPAEYIRKYGRNDRFYDKGQPMMLNEEEIIKNLRLRGIDYFIGEVPSNHRSLEYMIKIFRESYNSESLNPRKIVDFKINLVDSHFVRDILTSIDKSNLITKTLVDNIQKENFDEEKEEEKDKEKEKEKEKEKKKEKSQEGEGEGEEEEYWYEEEEVDIISIDKTATLKSLLSEKKVPVKKQVGRVKISRRPIGRGNYNFGFHMLDLKSNKHMVGKLLIEQSEEKKINKERILKELAVHTITYQLSEYYNAQNPIEFIDLIETKVYFFKNRNKYNYFLAQPYLSLITHLKHFHLNKKSSLRKQRNFLRCINDNDWRFSHKRWVIAQAFTHLSYHLSDQKWLITEFKGINTLILNPKLYHMDKEKWYEYDEGKSGIENWIRNHKCNVVCKMLHLEEIDKSKLTPLPDYSRMREKHKKRKFKNIKRRRQQKGKMKGKTDKGKEKKIKKDEKKIKGKQKDNDKGKMIKASTNTRKRKKKEKKLDTKKKKKTSTKTKQKKKKNKQTNKPKHPPYRKMITNTLKQTKSQKGWSRQKIYQKIKSKYQLGFGQNYHLRSALEKLSNEGIVKQKKQHFTLTANIHQVAKKKRNNNKDKKN
ncbi:alpha-protein kinase vwka [Anaeramoeba flamelloides]|uniref:Alpha-protein kinase vwka n=1 Tax=Anaeramoeba flamelloides TaxID=1746091 RepID=A0AAV7Y7F0_9EUKA|nr:alpha-protein kinase vwka [Anaeramoeba flamelloides]